MTDIDVQIEADLAIATALIRKGLERFYKGDDGDYPEEAATAQEFFGDDVRITHFVVLPLFQFTDDNDGREREMVFPMSTSKSMAMKYGIIDMGRQSLDEDAE